MSQLLKLLELLLDRLFAAFKDELLDLLAESNLSAEGLTSTVLKTL